MTLRPRDRMAIGFMLAVVLVACFYFLLLRPPLQHASSLSGQIRSEQAALLQAQSEYQAGHAAKRSLKAEAANWAALERALPDDAQIPALLRVLQHSVDAARVSLTSVVPGGSASAGAGSTTGSGSTSAGTAGKSASTVPLALDFTGSYGRLEDLVRRLNNLVVISGQKVRASGPLMSIGSIALSGSGSKLTLNLTATIYQRAAVSTTAATEGTS